MVEPGNPHSHSGNGRRVHVCLLVGFGHKKTRSAGLRVWSFVAVLLGRADREAPHPQLTHRHAHHHGHGGKRRALHRGQFYFKEVEAVKAGPASDAAAAPDRLEACRYTGAVLDCVATAILAVVGGVPERGTLPLSLPRPLPLFPVLTAPAFRSAFGGPASPHRRGRVGGELEGSATPPMGRRRPASWPEQKTATFPPGEPGTALCRAHRVPEGRSGTIPYPAPRGTVLSLRPGTASAAAPDRLEACRYTAAVLDCVATAILAVVGET